MYNTHTQRETAGVYIPLSTVHSIAFSSAVTLLPPPFFSTDFLLSETMAARLTARRSRSDPEPMETDQPSYSVPANLAAILKVYDLSTPPSHITIHKLFDRLIGKVWNPFE